MGSKASACGPVHVRRAAPIRNPLPPRRPKGVSAVTEKSQTACTPGSVPLLSKDGQPFLCDARYRTPDATHPGRGPETAHAHPLFGLAPGGVYHAGRIAEAPVGAYPTLSPLPHCWGGLLSVALSLGSRRVDVIHRLVSMEPGLSSNGQLPNHQRLPSRLEAGI